MGLCPKPRGLTLLDGETEHEKDSISADILSLRPRSGAQVAPQRCLILPAGKIQYITLFGKLSSLQSKLYLTWGTLQNPSCCLRAGACGRGAPAGRRRAHLRQARGCSCVSPCALALADDGSCRSIIFFACAAGGQEDPQAGPSCQSPGPRGEEGAPSPPLDSTLTPSGITSCIDRKRCSMGAKRVSFEDYRGPHQVSQFDSIEIRSTPKMQLFRVSPLLNEGAVRSCSALCFVIQ